MDLGTIRCNSTSEMVLVVAGLVREGLTFTCRPDAIAGGLWLIVLTGGY